MSVFTSGVAFLRVIPVPPGDVSEMESSLTQVWEMATPTSRSSINESALATIREVIPTGSLLEIATAQSLTMGAIWRWSSSISSLDRTRSTITSSSKAPPLKPR